MQISVACRMTCLIGVLESVSLQADLSFQRAVCLQKVCAFQFFESSMSDFSASTDATEYLSSLSKGALLNVVRQSLRAE